MPRQGTNREDAERFSHLFVVQKAKGRTKAAPVRVVCASPLERARKLRHERSVVLERCSIDVLGNVVG